MVTEKGSAPVFKDAYKFTRVEMRLHLAFGEIGQSEASECRLDH